MHVHDHWLQALSLRLHVKRPALPELNPCHGNPGSFASASLSMFYQAGPCLAEQVTREPFMYGRAQR